MEKKYEKKKISNHSDLINKTFFFFSVKLKHLLLKRIRNNC